MDILLYSSWYSSKFCKLLLPLNYCFSVISDKQLIESLETYKDLFDHAHDLIHIVYPDGKIIYINNAWEKLLEYPQEEVQGKSIYSLVVPEDKQMFKNYRDEVINGCLNQQVVVNLLSKSGQKITVEGFISVRITEGKPLYTRGIFRDISRRLRNESQLQQLNEILQEREGNLQNLLTNAPDAIIVVDDESKIIYWNPKAVTLFGWTEKEAIGNKLTDTIVPVQYREAHNKGMSRYLTTGEAHVLNQTLELSALNKQGIEFYISLTISAARQHGKKAFIAFIRDIDQEKRNELELGKKRQELEQSNRELEQFAYVASHDLQEPLRKILFFSNLVLDDNELTEGSKKNIEKISHAAHRMKGLISNLLDFSRLSQTNLFFEEVNLNTVVSGVLTDFELMIKQKNAIIELDNLPILEAIPMQMHQLFFNLIGNGLKFSRRHVAPVIKITAKKISKERKIALPELLPTEDYYEIIVTDNGIGFNQEYAEKIFTIFQRLNQRSQYEGYGIGLAVCQKIIKTHNGIIWAQGHPLYGATFGFILPCKQIKSSFKE